LNRRHLERSKTEPAFVLLRQSSERVAKNKSIKELSLNIETRKARRDSIESQSLVELNAYRETLGLEPVTTETRKDNPLPDEDEHWNIVYHTEAARILLDQNKWTGAVFTKTSSSATAGAN